MHLSFRIAAPTTHHRATARGKHSHSHSHSHLQVPTGLSLHVRMWVKHRLDVGCSNDACGNCGFESRKKKKKKAFLGDASFSAIQLVFSLSVFGTPLMLRRFLSNCCCSCCRCRCCCCCRRCRRRCCCCCRRCCCRCCRCFCCYQ